MDWVCRDAWKGPFSQSIFYAGGIVGTLGFGVMADHVGRYSLQSRIYTTFSPYKKYFVSPMLQVSCVLLLKRPGEAFHLKIKKNLFKRYRY